MERMILTLSLRALGPVGDVATLTEALWRLPGVLDVLVQIEAGVVRLEVDPRRFTFRRLRPSRGRLPDNGVARNSRSGQAIGPPPKPAAKSASRPIELRASLLDSNQRATDPADRYDGVGFTAVAVAAASSGTQFVAFADGAISEGKRRQSLAPDPAR